MSDQKDPFAVALGRRGGLKGGPARAANMTAEERSNAARTAARARWEARQPPTLLSITWADGVDSADVRRLSQAWAARISEKNAVAACRVQTDGTAPQRPTPPPDQTAIPVIIGATVLHLPMINPRDHGCVCQPFGEAGTRRGKGPPGVSLCGTTWSGVYVHTLAPDLPLCRRCASSRLVDPATLVACLEAGIRAAR